MALVHLMSAGSHVEAQLVQGLLATEGIHAVVQGESRHTDMGTEAGFAEIQVLVPEEQLDVARVLLSAKAVPDGPAAVGRVPEGAVCPVHEGVARATCGRCGSFLCDGCGPLGEPPVCEACLARSAPRSRAGTKLVALLLLAFLLGLPVIGVAIARALGR